jgi:hypothetical protein
MLKKSETAFLSVRINVVVKLDTLDVNRLTPVTQTACVATLSSNAVQICLIGIWSLRSTPR